MDNEFTQTFAKTLKENERKSSNASNKQSNLISYYSFKTDFVASLIS